LKRWGWLYWIVLIAYSAAVFILVRGLIVLALVLTFLPILATIYGFKSIHREMIDYLHDNYSEAWGDIARDMSYVRAYRRSLLAYDDGIEDTDYKVLRSEYRRALWAFRFSVLAYLATIIYAAVTSVHR
jgi:hypothetical protein